MSMMRELLMARQQKKEIVKWLDANREDPEMAASDAAAIAVFKRVGLCERDDYMTVEEANAVVTLPSFKGISALKNWDWSALTNIYDSLWMHDTFMNTGVTFTTLPEGFGSQSVYLGKYHTDGLFWGCKGLTSLTLPEGFGAKAINGNNIFRDCSNLESIHLNSDCLKKATIISGLFSGCSKLSSIELPSGFGSVATQIGIDSYNTGVFYGCSSLTSLTLPEGFGKRATATVCMFYGCSSLTSLTLPEGFGINATSVAACFCYCRSLTSLILPEGFGVIATNVNNCFDGCKSLTSLTLPEGFGAKATLMQYTFQNCKNLPETFYLGDVSASNYSWMFNGCTNLKKIVGTISLTKVNNSVVHGASLFMAFTDTQIQHVIFVGDLKYSFNNLVGRGVNGGASLVNIDNESLFSLAETFHDWWNEDAEQFEGNDGKNWTVTSAQKAILDTEMYDATRTYTQYVEDKGWTVTTG